MIVDNVIERRSRGPHYAKWYQPEDGVVPVAATRHHCSNRHTFQPSADQDLDVRCWCALYVVQVPARAVARGITYACGERCASVARRQFGVTEPVIADRFIRIRDLLIDSTDPEEFYDQLLAGDRDDDVATICHDATMTQPNDRGETSGP